MKKIFHAHALDFFRDWWWLLAIISFCSVGCYLSIISPDYRIVEIDGCQFIQSTKSYDVPLVHKPNCPNHHEQ